MRNKICGLGNIVTDQRHQVADKQVREEGGERRGKIELTSIFQIQVVIEIKHRCRWALYCISVSVTSVLHHISYISVRLPVTLV